MSDEAPNEKANGADGADSAKPAEAAPATPEERIDALEAELKETKDRLLRVAAEFENFKKRARVTQMEAETAARERVLKDVLEIADNLERAVDHGGNGSVDGATVLKGVTLVLRVLQQKLERHDVRAFEAKGQVFDPRLHEAISRVDSDDVPVGAVAVELQKGYKIGEKLLRPAMVSVSSGPKGPQDADAGAEAGKAEKAPGKGAAKDAGKG
jgi:molecular chaperone GrpE